MSDNWKQCYDFPNYEVSETGKMRRQLNGREIAIAIDSRGYSVVRIWYNKKKYTKRIAKLIWQTFNDCACGMTIDHIDRNKQNNNLSNLRCISHSENSRNRTIYGKNVYNLNQEKKKEILHKLKEGASLKSIWIDYGIPTNYMGMVLQRGSWEKLTNDRTGVSEIQTNNTENL